MPKTSNSAVAPYATPADLIARVDVNLLGDLVRDDGTRATPAELLTDPNLGAALADAAGEIESVLFMDQRYTREDLAALGGNDLAFLKRLNCALALQKLRERRGLLDAAEYPLTKWGAEKLDALSTGAIGFTFAETEAAGLAAHRPITPEDLSDATPTLASNMTRYFGRRRNRLYETP